MTGKVELTGMVGQALDGGQPEGREVHITSLVVLVTPAAVGDVVEIINDVANAEVHIADPSGKLVVSLETGTLYQVTEQVDSICALNGVISATLVYHQFEDEDALDQPVDAAVETPGRPAHRETEQ